MVRLYRPGDTHLGREGAFRSDWSLVYWSQEERNITLSKVVDKCVLVCSTAIDQPIHEFVKAGPNRFYFDKMYVPNAEKPEEAFVPLPDAAERVGAVLSSKGKGGKSLASKSSKSAQQPALVSSAIHSYHVFIFNPLHFHL